MSTDPETLTARAHERIREMLGLEAGAVLDQARLGDVLAMVLKEFIGIDQVTTGAWGQMAPASDARSASRIGELAGAYLKSGSDEDRAALLGDLEAARLLGVCLLAATPRAGQVSWRHVARLAPERLEGVAKAEKKWNESLEFACWRKYKELAGEMDSAGFEDEVMSAIGSYVQTLLDKRQHVTDAADAGGGS